MYVHIIYYIVDTILSNLCDLIIKNNGYFLFYFYRDTCCGIRVICLILRIQQCHECCVGRVLHLLYYDIEVQSVFMVLKYLNLTRSVHKILHEKCPPVSYN